MSPITLRHCEDLIDRVSARYPWLTKHQVVVISTLFFQQLRDCLAAGHTVSINGFVPSLRIGWFVTQTSRGLVRAVKACVTTPERLRHP